MPSKRLLIIEDDPGLTELIRRVAEEAGYEVQQWEPHIPFIALYCEFQPHVIVLDIILPEMDGFEILRHLSKERSDARIIILSGQENYRPMASRMGKGLDLNIVATVAKPCRIVELHRLLQQVGDSVIEAVA